MTPLAVDAYLPAMPAIADDFSVSIHQVELTLSLFLGGFSIGQLIGGPFSDHLGRRRTALTGIGLFLLGTLGVILSPDIHWMWLFRVLQALGGGLAVVNGPAIIRDLSSGSESAKNLSYMALIMMMAPLLAPLIGMLLLHATHWRGIFLFLFLYALIIGVAIHRRLPETRRIDQQRTGVLQRYWQVLRHRHALGYLFAQGFTYAGMFAFITASPLVYMHYFGLSETLYPFIFGINVIAMVVMSRLNILLLIRLSPKRLLSLGQLLQITTGGLLLAYLLLVSEPWLPVVVCCVILFVGCQGLIVANATASTVEFFPHNSATATALLGAGGFLMGAGSSSLVGLFGDGTPIPMAGIMWGCALLGLLSRLLLQLGAAPASAGQ